MTEASLRVKQTVTERRLPATFSQIAPAFLHTFMETGFLSGAPCLALFFCSFQLTRAHALHSAVQNTQNRLTIHRT